MEFQPLQGGSGARWGNLTMIPSVVGVAVGALVGATLVRSWQLCSEVAASAKMKAQMGASKDETHSGASFADLTGHRHYRNMRRLQHGPDEFWDHTRVVICEEVREYRRAATQLVKRTDSVLEIGCHVGGTTRFISENAGVVLGVDQVVEHVREAERRILPGTSFVIGNILDSCFVEGLPALVSPPKGVKPAFSVVFVDISGSRDVATLVKLKDTLLALLKPRPALLVFKSQKLKALLLNCELWVDCPERIME